ncbi:MAG: maltose alpha-D-glucosyltransferase [Syntrophobacteraceae bacterium]|jgi:maltose alpha-D-glucosyltransferase/alpha-amylase
MPQTTELNNDPLWFKDAIIYEVHVKAFFDSDNDGIGDFRGLRQKLDYIKDLGVTAVWLLPFNPSPLRDGGYDIADFFNIHPYYGTLADFREFLREAHKRDIRVITELVLNHTSDQHPWFQRARRSKPGSVYRDFYVWSDTPQKYLDARIIFTDFETSNWTWDPVAKAYYWHRFYSHQPDLNYDSPHVRKAMFRVIDFWLKMGVDGMRLDAVPYLFEREGTNCENQPETYEFLRQLRAHVNAKFKDRMLLAEANQWPEDAVAYFGNGDICHMVFHFPLMPRMFMAIQMEDSFPIQDILDQTPQIPENCQWALFLRNHDELTLEMVTDEERDYMYRMYARDPRARINLGIRRRLAPLLGNDLQKIRLLYALLFCLPGSPIVYYGSEILMGDNYYLGDRDGVRTPMQWSPDRNAGFSKADPQQLYLPVVIDPEYHFQTRNAETEEKTPSSFLWFMRHLISNRKRFRSFGRGSMQIVHSSNKKVFSFIRAYGDEKILVAVNLSRYPQESALDMREYAGVLPHELVSRKGFRQIEQSPYVLTFGPYGGYLFLLEEGAAGEARVIPAAGEGLEIGQNWLDVLRGKPCEILEDEILPGYISGRRWFGGKARNVQQIRISEAIPILKDSAEFRIALLNVEYTEGLPEIYVIPIGSKSGEEAHRISSEFPAAVISRLKLDSVPGILYDAIYSERFCTQLLDMIARRRGIKLHSGEISAYRGKSFSNKVLQDPESIRPKVLKADQSNTSVVFGQEYFLKVYRHPGEGTNPDLEISRFLTEVADFPYIPAFAGAIELKRKNGVRLTIGILLKYVQNQTDAFNYFMSGIHRYFEEVLSRRTELPSPPIIQVQFLNPDGPKIPSIGGLESEMPFEMISLLGARTAQMHLALASGASDPNFEPENFTLLWQRSLFQSMQSLQKRVFELLSSNLPRLSPETAADASGVLSSSDRIISIYRSILKKKISAKRIRVHGDYHLGQVLFTGKDYVIIDFEGEPARPIGERRNKASPLKDVAGMVRSFQYTVYIALLKESHVRVEDVATLEPWAEFWYRSSSAVFLHSYFDTVKGSGLIPDNDEELKTLLDCFLLDKAIYEIGYELNNRPDWVMIPLKGLRLLFENGS